MKKILILLFFVTTNVFANGFYSNNQLLRLCDESPFFCDGYFAGFLDGIFSETKMKNNASISPSTLKRLFLTRVGAAPEVGDFVTPLTISYLLELNNYAEKKISKS